MVALYKDPNGTKIFMDPHCELNRSHTNVRNDQITNELHPSNQILERFDLRNINNQVSEGFFVFSNTCNTIRKSTGNVIIPHAHFGVTYIRSIIFNVFVS